MKKFIVIRNWFSRWFLVTSEDKFQNENGEDRIRFYLDEIDFENKTFEGLKPSMVDGRFPQPPDFVFDGQSYKFRLIGNSGKMSRREWITYPNLPKISERALVLRTDKEFANNSIVLENPEFNEETIEYYDDRLITEYNKHIENFRMSYSISVAPIVESFMEIKEANKSLWFPYLNMLDGNKFIILHEYHTSCGNTTLLVHPYQRELQVPDNYKGIVIGKAGNNIKNLCNRYKLKFVII